MRNLMILFLSALTGLSGHSHAQGKWYKAQMHCHTTESDGDVSPNVRVEQYIEHGYDIIVLTDHNVLTVTDTMDYPGVLLVQGEELTSTTHINGIGMHRGVSARGMGSQQMIDSIVAQGGVAQFNHPKYSKTNGGDILKLENCHLMEMYNYGSELANPNDVEVWDQALALGKLIYGTGTDDLHFSFMIDKAWSMVYLDTLSTGAFLEALREGRLYASNGAHFSYIEAGTERYTVAGNDVATIRFVGKGGQVLAEFSKDSAVYKVQGDEGYVRAEIEGHDGKKAWSQPVPLVTFGVRELMSPISIASIGPNPAGNEVVLAFEMERSGYVRISLVDISGRTVRWYGEESLESGSYLKRLGLEGLAPGIYYIALVCEGGRKVVKLIKN